MILVHHLGANHATEDCSLLFRQIENCVRRVTVVTRRREAFNVVTMRNPEEVVISFGYVHLDELSTLEAPLGPVSTLVVSTVNLWTNTINPDGEDDFNQPEVEFKVDLAMFAQSVIVPDQVVNHNLLACSSE